MNRSRVAAFQILTRWENSPEHVYIETLLTDHLRKNPLPDNDASLVRALTLGTLQNRSLLDHWIDAWRRGKVSKKVRVLLRLGLYQILFLRIPDHAAVNETVALAGGARERSYVNALLRRATREREKILSAHNHLPLQLRYSLPDFLVTKWIARYGEAAAKELCALMNAPAPIYLRPNKLRKASASHLPADAAPFPPDPRFYEIKSVPGEFLGKGFGYIQDPSTAFACDLLSPTPRDKVLDACAAPGGKTSLLADHMNNEGSIIACDSSQDRLDLLQENIQRLGVTNTATCQIDWTKLSKTEALRSFPHLFDKILIDVPCSNTGVMRRRVDVRWRISPKSITALTQTQGLILDRVLPLLGPGGHLVYSTCSIEPEENHQVVAAALEKYPNLSLVEEKTITPITDGIDGAYAALIKKD